MSSFLFLVMPMSKSADYDFFVSLAMTDLVTTDELLLLMAAHTVDVLQADKPHDSYETFDIENFSDSQCRALFRFHKDELVQLSSLLALPHEYKAQNGIIWSPMEGTCMLLRRLCYPGQLLTWHHTLEGQNLTVLS